MPPVYKSKETVTVKKVLEDSVKKFKAANLASSNNPNIKKGKKNVLKIFAVTILVLIILVLSFSLFFINRYQTERTKAKPANSQN